MLRRAEHSRVTLAASSSRPKDQMLFLGQAGALQKLEQRSRDNSSALQMKDAMTPGPE